METSKKLNGTNDLNRDTAQLDIGVLSSKERTKGPREMVFSGKPYLEGCQSWIMTVLKTVFHIFSWCFECGTTFQRL